MSERKIIELGNMNPPKEKFQSPQVGRVYSIHGISPTLRACIYKDPPRILVARHNEKLNISMRQLVDYVTTYYGEDTARDIYEVMYEQDRNK